MPEYCSCGAQLPPDARFCHKCGKPQFDYPGPEEIQEPGLAPLPAAPQPAVPTEIGFHNRTAVRTGFVAALLAFLLISIPLPVPWSLLWLLICCVAAGFCSALLYRYRTHQKLSLRGGARMGWITGVFSFTISVIFFTLTVVSLSGSGGGLLAAFKNQFAGKDPNVEQFLHLLENPGGMAIMLLLTLVFMFFLFTVLPTVGGALCAKLMEARAVDKE